MANQWKAVTGPGQWFSCRIPLDWTLRDSSSVLDFFAPDGKSRITIHAWWHPARDVSVSSLLDVPTLFPQAFGLRKLAPVRIPQASAGVEGSLTSPAPAGLGRRLFAPASRRAWQAFAIRHEQVCLVCVLEQTTEIALSKTAKRLFRRILETLEFPPEPASPPDEFARRILRAARRQFPDEKAQIAGNLQLAIGDTRVNLANFYRAYIRDTESFSEISESLLGTVEKLLSWRETEVDCDFDSVRERVMPMLAPDSVWRESLTEFVSVPWIAGLRIMYVVDEQDAYWYIRDGQLQDWAVDREHLHDLALANLNRYFEDQAHEMTAVGEDESQPRVLMPTNADAYNSVRLLAQPFHRRLQQLLGAEFAVGIPNRDFFVAVSLKNTEMLDRVRGRVAADFQTMDHPLTDRILIVSTDGVSEYCEP